MDLANIYRRRFKDMASFRGELYRILCREFYQKYIGPDDTVVDLAAGYCELINNINAKRKIAVDLNPDTHRFAGPGVETIQTSSCDLSKIADDSVDAVFANNFLEHLTREDILKTLKEVFRILKTKGRLFIIQPNYRYCYRDFFMFFDHITPLDDRAMVEVLEINGFKILECRPKFLPYSTKQKLPFHPVLVRLYLKIPVLHYFFGKQLFIRAQK